MYDLTLDSIFGLHQTVSELTLFHLAARGVVVYFIGMFLVRIHSQFVTMNTPFNYMINFIIGSLLANAIVGEGSYFKIVGVCLLIYMINFIIEALCYASTTLEGIFRGSSDLLVKDGKIVWKNMRKNLVTQDELMQAIRTQVKHDSLEHIKRAYYENNGSITIVKD